MFNKIYAVVKFKYLKSRGAIVENKKVEAIKSLCVTCKAHGQCQRAFKGHDWNVGHYQCKALKSLGVLP